MGFLIYTVCGEIEAISNLEVQVYDVGVSRIGLTSADISVKLGFENPTRYKTPSFRAEFDVYLAGNYLGHGSVPQTEVLAGSSTIQTMTLTVNYVDVGRTLIEALMRGDYSISIKGTIYAKILFGLVPMSKSFSA